MSREIKYRAWHMPFGSKGPMQHMMHGTAGSVLEFYEMAPDKYIVEQYTGLKDKNGEDIYEGDIVKIRIGDAWQTVPELVENVWDPHVWIHDNPYYAVNRMLIIGNIHEDAQLLED